VVVLFGQTQLSDEIQVLSYQRLGMSGGLGDFFERHAGTATELDASEALDRILDLFGIVKGLGPLLDTYSRSYDT
jgi:hypothetical protein